MYQFLAARYHSDNTETGDAEKFELLTKAYDVLSNASRRAQYDATCGKDEAAPAPLSSSLDFMDNIDGELNRRVAVLAVLYMRRRTNPAMPSVSLAEVEQRMGFPRDYLEFTMWYVYKKGWVTKSDGSAFTLTAEGVDFVETQRGNVPALKNLLAVVPDPPSSHHEPSGNEQPSVPPETVDAPISGEGLPDQ